MYADISVGDMRLVVRLALWAALMALGGWIAIPIGPVPVTLQTFFIILAGFMEGPRAFFAATLYILAGLLGLPVFAGGLAGPALLLAPSAGFALMFPAASALAGLATRGSAKVGRFVVFGILASLLIYGGGIVGLHINLGLDFGPAFLAILPFLPGDSLKIFAAVGVATGALRVGKRLK